MDGGRRTLTFWSPHNLIGERMTWKGNSGVLSRYFFRSSAQSAFLGRPALEAGAMPSLFRRATTLPRVRPSRSAITPSEAVPSWASSSADQSGPGAAQLPFATAACAPRRIASFVSSVWGWRDLRRGVVELFDDPADEGFTGGPTRGDIPPLPGSGEADDDFGFRFVLRVMRHEDNSS